MVDDLTLPDPHDEPSRVAAVLAQAAPAGWQETVLNMTVSRSASSVQLTVLDGDGRTEPIKVSSVDPKGFGALRAEILAANPSHRDKTIRMQLKVLPNFRFTFALSVAPGEPYSDGRTRTLDHLALPSRVTPVLGAELDVGPEAVMAAVAQFRRLQSMIESGRAYVLTDNPDEQPRLPLPLPGPASEEAIVATEAAIGRRLPADLRAIYSLANGHTEMPAILGWTEMLPVQDIPGEWARTSQPGDWGGWANDWNSVSIDHQFPSAPVPVDAIAPVGGHPQWIPFGRDGGGNVLLMDMVPGPGGQVGQIIEAGGDMYDGPELVATSLAALLERMARTGQTSRVEDPTLQPPPPASEPAWDDWVLGLAPAWQEKFRAATSGRMSRSGFADVRALVLESGTVPDLIPLVSLTGLQKLTLRGVGDKDLSILEHLSQLRSVVILSTSQVTLPPLPAGLLDLQIRAVGVELASLRSHPSLGTVLLETAEPTDLGPLAELPRLEGLDASLCLVDDLLDLLALRNLRYLNLGYQQWKCLESRRRELPRLAAVSVAGDPGQAREVLAWFESGGQTIPTTTYQGSWGAVPLETRQVSPPDSPEESDPVATQPQSNSILTETPVNQGSPGELAFLARQRLWAQFGEVDTDVLAHVINPAFMGGPMWPDLRQAFIRSRGATTTIVASDGLSDPFRDPANAIPNLSGLGLEVFIETDDPELAGEFSAIRNSWAFVLAYEVAQNAAADGDFDLRLEKYGVLSMDFWDMDVPPAYGDGSRIGVLIGMPAPGITTTIDTGSGSATMLAVTVLTPAELNYILTNGAAGRNQVAAALDAAGIHHRSPVSRASVI